ncbi:adenylate/guanylate cyclase domain-containing protein [Nocardioides daejeonensis]|uniref:adenylate/guanylate cyclase domain-containing protein n=1 Tax=Nocardioides daejeonensis TaxID=1046556 RepID=UPI000D748E7A|nr:adenylate/guanylate cyclase domain-containing protein [Nocardioides daejeonensis]
MGPDPRYDDVGRSRLEQALLRDTPQWTADDVAERSGTSPERTKRIWRALGFPEPGSEEPLFTDGDVEAMAILNRLIDSGMFTLDTALNLTRGVGQTMARLADWEVATLTPRLEEVAATMPPAPDGSDERISLAALLAETVAEDFEQLLLHAWRRHIAVAVARTEALELGSETQPSLELTVGFADLVQFTALTNEIGEIKIGDLVEVFESRCHDVVSRNHGRVIKSLGDSVLFVALEPIAAMEIAEGIVSVIGRDPRMPDVRLGLATGSVVMRMGDVFGPPVNMAARLTTVARKNRIIIDEHTATLLPEDRWETRPMPARPVRGFGIVEPITVRRR